MLGRRKIWVRISRCHYVVLGWRWIVASGMGIGMGTRPKPEIGGGFDGEDAGEKEKARRT